MGSSATLARRRGGAGLVALLALVLGGCDDSATQDRPVTDGDAPRGDAGRDASGHRDGGRDDAADGRDGGADARILPPVDGAPPSDAADGATPTDSAPLVPIDAALPAECGPRDQVCVQDDPARRAVRRCSPDGRFLLDRCPEDTICIGEGRCVTDPAVCRPGEADCATHEQPIVCAPGGGGWVEQAPCPDNTLCTAGGLCRQPACGDAAASNSYLGCDFTAADLPNLAYLSFGGPPTTPFGIVLANADQGRSVEVTLRGGDRAPAPLLGTVRVEPGLTQALLNYQPVELQTEVLDAHGVVVHSAFDRAERLEIPPGGMAVLLLRNMGYFEQSRRGVRAHRVQSSGPLAAYQFSPYCCNFSVTNDASLLLPDSTLGTDYIYLGVPSWASEGMEQDGQWQPGGSYPATLTVAATHARTHVEVTPAPGATLNLGQVQGVQRVGDTLTFTLEAGEVIDLFSGAADQRQGRPLRGVDLSGTRVRATRPISVFSGHLCTYYPWDREACDHVEEQLLPVDTWGRRYAMTPPRLRARDPATASETTYWKLTGDGEPVRITLNVQYTELLAGPPGFLGVTDCADRLDGPNVIALGAGEVCELGTRRAFVAEGDRPFSALGIISGQATTGILATFGAHAGDPAIFMVPPIRQWRNSYDFVTPATYFANYITLTGPAGVRYTLDDQVLEAADGTPIPGTELTVLHVSVQPGPHRVTSVAAFALLVYAYDDYVSYVYTGGLGLNKGER